MVIELGLGRGCKSCSLNIFVVYANKKQTAERRTTKRQSNGAA